MLSQPAVLIGLADHHQAAAHQVHFPGRVCPHSMHEQIRFGGAGVVAERPAHAFVERAFAVAAGSGEDGQDVFADRAEQADAD